MQPVIITEDGAVRFKQNAIIDWLFMNGKLDLNEITIKTARGEFPKEDYMQIVQMLGYTVSGYGDLSNVTDEAYAEAADAANKVIDEYNMRAKDGAA